MDRKIKIKRLHPRRPQRAMVLMLAGLLASKAHAASQTCVGPEAIGVARTIRIDAAQGGLYGSMSSRASRPSVTAKKEVVLTFDDGPMPWVTRSILDTLDRYCTKATFFAVGRMAIAYPATVRDILVRGHTLGTHTFSHPYRMARMKPEAAHEEIERGFAAVATAAGGPIAPFFRFTGLSDSAALIDYLGQRRMAAFTVDAVSNDSYIHDPAQLAARTLAEVEARGGGIILFHDIKTTTAKALPAILDGLKAKGYRVAHLVAGAPAEPRLELMAQYATRLARAPSLTPGPGGRLLPFYGSAGTLKGEGEISRDLSQKPGGNRQGTAARPVLKKAVTDGDAQSEPPLLKGPAWETSQAGTWPVKVTETPPVGDAIRRDRQAAPPR